MRTNLALTWRLLRGGGRRGLLGSLLMVAAVAMSTGLLMFAVGANHAFGQRAEADAWRHPAKASGKATALEALSTDYVRGKPITVVDLAALSDRAPVPPGMSRFPKPGEAWVSPALAELMGELPADQLAKRFPGGAPAGVLREAALVHPGELVAVVGQNAADPVMKAARADDGMDTTAAPAPIDSYQTGTVSGTATMYRVLTVIASVLMVVPLLVFGGAAARLSVARRDQRLAALRLVGATPGQVVGITVTEAVLTALAGAVLGVIAYTTAIPALTQIKIADGTWFAGDLWPGALWTGAVLLAVPLLVGLSAVFGLRRVVVSPLGVARRQTPPGMKAIRVAVFAVLLIGFGVVSGSLTGMGKAGVVVFVAFLGLAFLGINLVGPWVVALIGRITAATARGPARLLAGRRLTDDPRSAWRTVSGIALTGFIAGFLSLLNVPGPAGSERADRLELTLPHGRSAAVAQQVKARLPDLSGRVTVRSLQSYEPARDAVSVTVPGGTAALDRARTALAGVAPGHVATTEVDDQATESYVLTDLRTGALTVLAVSFLIAIASAGITSASSVLDRRQTYALLRLAGTPLKVLDRARRQETLIPLAVMGGGSLLTGLFFAAPFAVGFGTAGAVTLLAFVLVGVAGVVGASALSRPLLRSVTADPAPRPD